MDPSFLHRLGSYQPDKQLISQNLEFVDKEKVIKSSFLQKIKYWINGTFNAKKTAQAIDQHITKILTDKSHSSSIDDLQLASTKLKELHKKFNKKGIDTLKNTTDRIDQAIAIIIKSKTSQESTAKIEKQNKTSSPPPSNFDIQLQEVQEQINKLQTSSQTLKKNVREIRKVLQKIAAENPDRKKALLPLIKTFKILETKGDLAFKPSFVQQQLIDKFNPTHGYDKKDLQIPFNKFLSFLKNSDHSGTVKTSKQLLAKSSQLKSKWSELENEFFMNQLSLEDKPQLKTNVSEMMKVLTNVRGKLENDYQLVLNLVKQNYSSKEFQNLISNYPNDDLELLSDEILNEEINQLAEQMLAKVNLSLKISPKDWEDLTNQLYLIQRDELAEDLKDKLKIYDWLSRNISHIKIPYDQMVDHHRNQSGGTCLQNSLRRHAQLEKFPNTPTNELEMGSDKKGRIRQAQVNLAFQFSGDNFTSINKSLDKEFNLDDDAKWIDRKVLLKDSQEYKAVVDNLIRPVAKDKSFNAIFQLSYYDESNKIRQGHVFNIQIDPKLKKFRIFDDNLGAMEFSSIEELKRELITYLPLFYAEHDEFEIHITT